MKISAFGLVLTLTSGDLQIAEPSLGSLPFILFSVFFSVISSSPPLLNMAASSVDDVVVIKSADAQHMEDTPPAELEKGEAPIFDAKLDRKMLLKLDLILVPMMCALYLLAFLDRANIGNARVAGLQADLSITDTQYQTAITVTYVPYIIAELPSNLVLKKVGPRILMPAMCLAWGLVTTAQSQVSSYEGLLACRAFLGLAEG